MSNSTSQNSWIHAFAVSAALCAGVLASGQAAGYEGKEPKAAEESAPKSRQYTFAWKFVDGDELAPRGGTTRGTPVTLAREPGVAWQRLHEPGISDFERERRAILAMAGEYRVSFDFIEVAGFAADYQPRSPYQSWGTEKVYVLEDRGDFISLQHILVTKTIGDDGTVTGPFVTKHWRQDWQFNPGSELVYRGQNTWQTVPVKDAGKDAWRQSVFQVDDSPRYSGVGHWQHFGNYSTWVGEEEWRPLPRREYSVRTDYQVLMGTNRHTITPTGWVHEQQNNKLALDTSGAPRAESPVVGREFGLNRYERIEGFDFTAGDRYVAATAGMWKAVRDEWASLLASPTPVRLKGAPDRDHLFGPLFELAEQLETGKYNRQPGEPELADVARAKVREYLAPQDGLAAAR